jgi:hypothetical protein
MMKKIGVCPVHGALGSTLRDTATYCHLCGKRLEYRAPTCGHEAARTGRFCADCGKPGLSR